MTETGSIAGFTPSIHGLHFANRYPPGPTVRFGVLDPRLVGVGDASAGLCGGMSWFVRERFEDGQPIPPDTVAPENGSSLFKAIVRRQVLSLDWLRGPFRFWWMGLLGPDRARRQTLEREWPRIREGIERGRLMLVGLVRHQGANPWKLTDSHQVLAFAYASEGPSGPITIRLYDPNWPNRDDITVHLGPDGFSQSTGETLLGVLALG